MELDQTPRPVPVRHSSAMAAACEHMYPGRPGRVRGGQQGCVPCHLALKPGTCWHCAPARAARGHSWCQGGAPRLTSLHHNHRAHTRSSCLGLGRKMGCR